MVNYATARYPPPPASGLADWPGPHYGAGNRITAGRPGLPTRTGEVVLEPARRRKSATVILSVLGEAIAVHGVGHYSRRVLEAAFRCTEQPAQASRSLVLSNGEPTELVISSRGTAFLRGSTRAEHLLFAVRSLIRVPLRPGVVCRTDRLRLVLTDHISDAYALAGGLIATGKTVLAAGFLANPAQNPQPMSLLAPVPTAVAGRTVAGLQRLLKSQLENVGAVTGPGAERLAPTIATMRDEIYAVGRPEDALRMLARDELDDLIGSLLASDAGCALLTFPQAEWSNEDRPRLSLPDEVLGHE